MFATINIPGSFHFEYYGPASRSECAAWLSKRVARLEQTQQITSLLPQRIVSNREAESWRYRDGSPVVRPESKAFDDLYEQFARRRDEIFQALPAEQQDYDAYLRSEDQAARELLR